MPRAILLIFIILAFTARLIAVDDKPALQITPDQAAIKPILTYQRTKPADSKLAVESACYFHPIATPKGVTLTDVAPDDHKHHRGVFHAFVETHGKKDADFWGWGEPAPTNGRKIVNREVKPTGPVSFKCTNEWRADDEVLVNEILDVTASNIQGANVIDLTYTLTPTADMTLSQWAFSGFCARLRKDGKVIATSPDGPVKRADPAHTKPESDWPDAAWYDYTITLPDGAIAGMAVLNHPKNPKTLWHNHTGLRMLNPCIVAPGPVHLKAKQPLILRYRLVAHDGAAPVELLNKLATEK